MPPGPGWIGHWSTRLGTVDLIATSDLPTTLTPQQVAQYPFAGSYELRRGDAAPVTGTLSCSKPTDNHLYCAWDDTGGTSPMIFVMNGDGNSFVANWGSPEGTTQFEGRRER